MEGNLLSFVPIPNPKPPSSASHGLPCFAKRQKEPKFLGKNLKNFQKTNISTHQQLLEPNFPDISPKNLLQFDAKKILLIFFFLGFREIEAQCEIIFYGFKHSFPRVSKRKNINPTLFYNFPVILLLFSIVFPRKFYFLFF